MIERGQNLRLSLESGEPIRVGRKCVRENLQSIVSLEGDVARSPDLAHPALANQSGDFIRAEVNARSQRHGSALDGL
jgi:hypothetical protein